MRFFETSLREMLALRLELNGCMYSCLSTMYLLLFNALHNVQLRLGSFRTSLDELSFVSMCSLRRSEMRTRLSQGFPRHPRFVRSNVTTALESSNGC